MRHPAWADTSVLVPKRRKILIEKRYRRWHVTVMRGDTIVYKLPDVYKDSTDAVAAAKALRKERGWWSLWAPIKVIKPLEVTI